MRDLMSQGAQAKKGCISGANQSGVQLFGRTFSSLIFMKSFEKNKKTHLKSAKVTLRDGRVFCLCF